MNPPIHQPPSDPYTVHITADLHYKPDYLIPAVPKMLHQDPPAKEALFPAPLRGWNGGRHDPRITLPLGMAGLPVFPNTLKKQTRVCDKTAIIYPLA